MITPELRKQIFLLVPKSFECKTGTFNAHKEYAPYAKVTEYLKAHPNEIYIVLDFADDEVYRDETPINYVFDYNMRKCPMKCKPCPEHMREKCNKCNFDISRRCSPECKQFEFKCENCNDRFETDKVCSGCEEHGEPITNFDMTVGTRNKCQLNLHLYATWQPNYDNIILAMEEILQKMQFWVLFDLESIVDYTSFNAIQEIDETEDRLLHRIVSCSFTYTNVTTRNVRTINSIGFEVDKVSPPPISKTHGKAEPFQKWLI